MFISTFVADHVILF